MNKYVVGFAYCGDKVLLIRKNRPDWQAGRLNGIGGHVEPGEVFAEAMPREFREETGIEFDDWELFSRIDGIDNSYGINFYRADLEPDLFYSYQTLTDEQVLVYDTNTAANGGFVIDNLRWLLPLGRHWNDHDYSSFHVHANDRA